MTELEREAERLLACYVVDERPPPAVDDQILARLRRETSDNGRALRWLVVGLITAAAVLLLWAFGPAVFSRQTKPDNSAALDSAEPSAQMRVPHQSSPAARPQPETTPVQEDDDPGVVTLRAARGLLRAESFKAAYKRLEPCPSTVGTDDLLEECELLVMQALCGAGELVEGRQRIAIFRKRWPKSIHAREISALCP